LSDFTYTPAYSSQLKTAQRVRTASFGDGYEQRVADGINTQPEVWQLTFTNVDTATADAIEAQLKGYAGVTAFTWTPPGRSQIKVVCDPQNGIIHTYSTANMATITCVFRQVFEA